MTLATGVRKRCGSACLPECDIHTWSWHVELPRDENGKRQPVQRSGYATPDDAAVARAEFLKLSRQGWRSDRYYRAAVLMLLEDMESVQLPTGGRGYVYFLRAGDYLKIGWSKNPVRRLSELRNPNNRIKRPEAADVRSAEMLGRLIGDRVLEESLKHLARNFWIEGEWYAAHPALVRALSTLIR